MWSDNETEKDFLNFTGVAGTVAEIIVQAQGRPISIGVSGAWGVGKSSMIKLVHNALIARGEEGSESEEKRDFVFVEFNAWLYQGYDDARAALIDVIADKLQAEAEFRKTGVDKVKDLLSRVNWLRVVKLAAAPSLALALGLPPTGLIGDIFRIGRSAIAGRIEKDTVDDASGVAKEAAETAGGLLNPKVDTSPPKEIHALRDAFEAALKDMGITLVVLIDDLDRCLPETTISTLEAIRLFLFLDNTAFVIAADNDMIKHAVQRHFEGATDKQVTNYFDKLIQVPIRVPPLGTQEVRAYMLLLFIENSDLNIDEIERIRVAVCDQLQHTWEGRRVDRAFVQGLKPELSPTLLGRLETADRLAHLMVTASGISGNPRLIKRFLNALSIRMAIARAQNVGVDEAALAKMLLFERCGNADAYTDLARAVTADAMGKPRFLAEWEDKAYAGAALDLKAPWDDPFIVEWLQLPPRLADEDLRGILYLSREHAPLISPGDRLSSDAAELLSAMLEHPDMSASLNDRLLKVPRAEMSIMMDHLLDRARQEQQWGAPPILDACLAISEADPGQGARLAAFLTERPHGHIKASLVPKIGDKSWAAQVFATWQKASDIGRQVKAAIEARK
jgi:predicted KAP-like P-loop ATPase